MAPEGYIRNTYGPKTEVWAFGITIYQMLHGTTPFSHIVQPEILLKALAVQLQTSDFRPDISPDLKDLMRSCLQIEEKKRISMAQIQFSQYMQRRQYNKYYVGSSCYIKHSSYYDKKESSSASNFNRYNSSVNTIKIPCRVHIREETNNENKYLEVPETAQEKEEKAKSKDRVIRVKSRLKIDNEPLSAVTKNPIIMSERIKAAEPKIRIIQPYKYKIDISSRKPIQVSTRTRYYDTFYQPLSAQLK